LIYSKKKIHWKLYQHDLLRKN